MVRCDFVVFAFVICALFHHGIDADFLSNFFCCRIGPRTKSCFGVHIMSEDSGGSDSSEDRAIPPVLPDRVK